MGSATILNTEINWKLQTPNLRLAIYLKQVNYNLRCEASFESLEEDHIFFTKVFEVLRVSLALRNAFPRLKKIILRKSLALCNAFPRLKEKF